MPVLKDITDSELIVMNVVWEENPIKASDIIAKVRLHKDWNPKTIHTLLLRLVKKDILGVDTSKTYKYYYPMICKDEYLKKETDSFLKKAFNGSIGLLISNFLKNEHLTDEDIDELQKIIDKKR
jgi:BlaI family transcriptional regulator, penicillinase repressor